MQMQSRSRVKMLVGLAALIGALLLAGQAVAGGITTNTFEVIEDSSSTPIWVIGDSLAVATTRVDTFFVNANGRVDVLWSKSDGDSSYAQLVNEAAANDVDYFYYTDTAIASYNSVKFDADTSKVLPIVDSVRILYRTATTAAAAKTLQCRWDSTNTGTGIVFDTVTADADSAYRSETSRPITGNPILGLTKRLVKNLTAGVYGITNAGVGKDVRVTWIVMQVFSRAYGVRIDSDTSSVYDAQYWETLTMEAKFHPLASGGGGADSGAVTIILEMSNDAVYWTKIDSLVAVDSLAAFKNFTMQPYRYARMVTHQGTKSDSAGVHGYIVNHTTGRW
jgi:hypothetical protein